MCKFIKFIPWNNNSYLNIGMRWYIFQSNHPFFTLVVWNNSLKTETNNANVQKHILILKTVMISMIYYIAYEISLSIPSGVIWYMNKVAWYIISARLRIPKRHSQCTESAIAISNCISIETTDFNVFNPLHYRHYTLQPFILVGYRVN